MPTDIQLRRGQPADRSALLALENATFDSDRISTRQWRHHLQSASGVVLLVEDGPQLLGSVLLLFRQGLDSARIYSLATAASARGRGIGSALLDAAEIEAAARGCRRLRLEVRRDNVPAQRLYIGHGYQPVGERANYYADGTDAVRYEKRLHPTG
ncbi:MAG: N-acetyltransferase [Dokdonella sp.]